MELDFTQIALEVSHHGYLLVTHLTTQQHCCHTPFHAYWYMNVMRSSRLFRVSLFLENGSILMIWGCFSIVSNVIRSNYCCTPCMDTWCFLGILFSLPHNKADVYLGAVLNICMCFRWHEFCKNNLASNILTLRLHWKTVMTAEMDSSYQKTYTKWYYTRI